VVELIERCVEVEDGWTMELIRRIRTTIKRKPWSGAIFPYAVLAGVAVLVFISQNRIVGFEPGYNALQAGFHGSVSSRTLAIISHATPANGFVGYVFQNIDENGKKDYEYFDRYPVFFSAGMHVLLSLKAKLSTQIYLAKQAMNGIFLLTLVAAYLLVSRLVRHWAIGLAAVLFSVSSQYLLFYKDMIHFDQPALLGFVFLMFAIAVHLRRPYRPLLYGSALAAVAMGRGYASITVLGVWFLLEASQILFQGGLSILAKARLVLKHDSLWVLLIAVIWAGSLLTYNVVTEAHKRQIPLMQTSIIQSAENRLALDESFNEKYAGILDWGEFLKGQVDRLVSWSFPIWDYEGSMWLDAAIVLAMLVIIVAYSTRLDVNDRKMLALMVLSGMVWLIAMRNLSAFHEYTTMFYLGIPLAFYASAFSLLRIPPKFAIVLLICALAVFAYRNQRTQDIHYQIGSPYNSFTYDLVRIREQLPDGAVTVYLPQGIKTASTSAAIGFYLPEAFLAPEDNAEYVITSDQGFLPQTLTPDNTRLFLFKR
jgi:hypothetical protein